MVNKEYFIFNGKKSTDLEIYTHLEDMPPIEDAVEDFDLIEVPGRDGFLTISNNRYKPITKRIVGILVNEDKRYEVRNWLQGSGKLILGNDPEVFYYATLFESPIFQEHWSGGWEITLEFKCQPYGYLLKGQNKIIIDIKNQILYNNYRLAKPHIKVFGTGRIDLFVNAKKIILDVDEYIEIDSELMESYKENNLIPFIGDFPVLATGENKFYWHGNVSKIEVVPRWRR